MSARPLRARSVSAEPAAPLGPPPAAPAPSQLDGLVAAAFARGDFAAIKALRPDFVAPAPGPGPIGRKPRPLFGPSVLVRAIAVGSAAVVTAAWAYALTRTGS